MSPGYGPLPYTHTHETECLVWSAGWSGQREQSHHDVTSSRAAREVFRTCSFSCLDRRKLESWVWLYMAGFPATGMYCARLRMRCLRLAASITCFFTWPGRDAMT